MMGGGPKAQNAKQQQRLEAKSAEQEGGRRRPGCAVETKQVDAGFGAAQAVGGRTRVAAVAGQCGQLGGHLVAGIMTWAPSGGQAVAQGRAGPGEGGRWLPFSRAERVEGVPWAWQHREVDDPRSGCGRQPEEHPGESETRSEQRRAKEAAGGSPPWPLRGEGWRRERG